MMGEYDSEGVYENLELTEGMIEQLNRENGIVAESERPHNEESK
jgi:hypothetical protein